MFFGRPYWNLGAVKQCLSKLPGFVERDSTRISRAKCSTRATASNAGHAVGVIRALPVILAIGRLLNNRSGR